VLAERAQAALRTERAGVMAGFRKGIMAVALVGIRPRHDLATGPRRIESLALHVRWIFVNRDEPVISDGRLTERREDRWAWEQVEGRTHARDPIVVRIATRNVAPARADDSAWLLAEMTRSPRASALGAKPQRAVVDGWPAIVLSGRSRDGILHRRWLIVDGHTEILIDAALAPKPTAAWQAAHDRISPRTAK